MKIKVNPSELIKELQKLKEGQQAELKEKIKEAGNIQAAWFKKYSILTIGRRYLCSSDYWDYNKLQENNRGLFNMLFGTEQLNRLLWKTTRIRWDMELIEDLTRELEIALKLTKEELVEVNTERYTRILSKI